MKIPEVELAKSVICNAYVDAASKKDSKDRREARAFLTGSSEGWIESLKMWCQFADVSYERIIKKSREMKKNNSWQTIRNENK